MSSKELLAALSTLAVLNKNTRISPRWIPIKWIFIANPPRVRFFHRRTIPADAAGAKITQPKGDELPSFSPRFNAS